MDDRGIARARALAKLLDSAARIPGTNIRFGLDPLLGLVPVVGDFAGAVLSGYIVLLAVKRGAPRAVVLRMLANVAIDTGLSSVPVVGDAFDIGWQSNTRNVALLERHLEQPDATHTTGRIAISLVVLVLIFTALGGVALTVLAIAALFRLLN